LFGRAWARADLLCNGTECAIVVLNLGQQLIGEIPKPWIIMLIAHSFEHLDGDLRATEVIV
jgi:hypothetical protein